VDHRFADPEQNLIFWGTGNAGPDYNGDLREGDNLHGVDCRARRRHGKMRWHYQFTPHDVRTGLTQVPVLADDDRRQLRKVVIFANRNGFFYVLDRVNGKLIYGKPFIQTSWAKEIRADGRPVLLPGSLPSDKGTRVCPDQSGGTNWMSPSFDPALGLLFVTARDACGTFYNWQDEYKPGEGFRGGAVSRIEEAQHASLRARCRDRRASLGVPLHGPIVGRRAVDRVRRGLRRVVGKSHGLRCAQREEPLALSDGIGLVRRPNDLHARRPPVRADAVRYHADSVRAAGCDAGAVIHGPTILNF
jgi:hypothetical protein